MTRAPASVAAATDARRCRLTGVVDKSLKQGQVIAGRYRIESLLGQGGVGSVYRAAQLPMARPVAVKVLADHDASTAPRAFQA